MKSRLKIAFIVNEFPCVSETFILEQMIGILEAGHDLSIFAYGKNTGGAKQHEVIEKYGLLNKTQFFPELPKSRSSRLGRLLNIIGRYVFRHPQRIFKALNGQGLGVYKTLNRFFTLEPLLDKDFDIVHCQYGTVAREWIFLKDIMNVKVVTSFRGYDITQIVKENGPSFYKELLQKGDVFLPVCKYFAQKLIEWGCPRERIFVLHSGIDISKFTVRENTENKTFRLFSVGRLVEKKGLEYSIKAAARLIKHHPQVEYTIVGEGPLRQSLQELIDSLGMKGNIHLAGARSSEEVAKLMGQAHIFILTSVTAQNGDQEGMPVSIMEAMAMGVPVISSLHSGIPELVEDGKSGFLLEEKDVSGIAEKCEYLMSHPDICQEMGRAGRLDAEVHTDFRRLNDRLLDLYQQALEAGRG